MKQEIKENGVAIGSIVVAGACLLTGNCQIGLMVIIPATIYQAGITIKAVVKEKRNQTDEL